MAGYGKEFLMNKSAEQKLEDISGVGPAIARELRAIGIESPKQLRKANPEKLYAKLCDFKAQPVDRCVLYVFRCAVYYCSNKEHDPDLLKWWNWKDKM